MQTGIMMAAARQRAEPLTLRWHVAFCTNTSDQRSIDCLRNAKYEVYYPQIRELRPVPKRRISLLRRRSPVVEMESVLTPFWPRYFFIHFSPLDERWHELFELAHVRGLICDERHGKLMPSLIDDSVIEGIRAMEINGGIPAKVTVQQIAYSIGEKVKITEGPFRSHTGIVDRLPNVAIGQLDEESKVRILVSLLGSSGVPIELPLSDIEKL